jgi:hypothetical protein
MATKNSILIFYRDFSLKHILKAQANFSLKIKIKISATHLY